MIEINNKGSLRIPTCGLNSYLLNAQQISMLNFFLIHYNNKIFDNPCHLGKGVYIEKCEKNSLIISSKGFCYLDKHYTIISSDKLIHDVQQLKEIINKYSQSFKLVPICVFLHRNNFEKLNCNTCHPNFFVCKITHL